MATDVTDPQCEHARPRNVFARNWRRATLDVTLRNPWRISAGRRAFRILTDGPTEHRYWVSLGPVRVALWPKATPTSGGRQEADRG